MRSPSLIEPVDNVEIGQLQCENFRSTVENSLRFGYRGCTCTGSQPYGRIALSPAAGEL